MFFAIKGNHFDGHNFINLAILNGANAIIVNRIFPVTISQIIVEDTKKALFKLAKWVRKKSNAKIIAITGSSGKTSVKEITANILSISGKTLKTKDNTNNHIGIALNLLRLEKDHKYAVLEVGANHLKEISYSSHLIKPQCVLINNVSFAHLSGFKNMKNIINAKGEIFHGLSINGTAIININSNGIKYWKKNLYNKKILYFSTNDTRKKKDFWAKKISYNVYYSKFYLYTPLGKIKIFFSLLGKHNIDNAIASAALAFSLQIPLKNIQIGLSKCTPIPGRLYPIFLKKNITILDDTYNSNPKSVVASMKTLCLMPKYRIMVISDMLELGNKSFNLHCKIGYLAKNMKINKILSIGIFSKEISKISTIGEHYYNYSTIVIRLLELLKQHTNITILIKGSRKFTMEKIIHMLQEKIKC